MDINQVRAAAQAAIAPLKAATSETKADKNFLFDAKRTDAGRSLPPYYLVYFLLVDLLAFRNIGQFEKVAWSVPVEYKGRAFLIEHRKFGLGILAADLPADESDAEEIAERIRKAVDVAGPYFDWLAEQAALDSKLNVHNRAADLFERYTFFLENYEIKRAEAERRADEKIKTEFEHGYSVTFPAHELQRESKWLALSTIESFFSWTEHIFILIAILQGTCVTGADVTRLAESNWETKFKSALDLADSATKKFYDELLVVRRQLRNFVAHGAFGKQGEAFQFHSRAGAVPLLLPHRVDGQNYRFGRGIDFVEHEAISLLDAFIAHLWSGPRAPPISISTSISCR